MILYIEHIAHIPRNIHTICDAFCCRQVAAHLTDVNEGYFCGNNTIAYQANLRNIGKLYTKIW